MSKRKQHIADYDKGACRTLCGVPLGYEPKFGVWNLSVMLSTGFKLGGRGGCKRCGKVLSAMRKAQEARDGR